MGARKRERDREAINPQTKFLFFFLNVKQILLFVIKLLHSFGAIYNAPHFGFMALRDKFVYIFFSSSHFALSLSLAFYFIAHFLRPSLAFY